MIRNVIFGAAALLLTACAGFGPPGIVLTRSDVAERAFVDRGQMDFGRIFKGAEGRPITGPEVGFQLNAQRIELAWTAKLGEAPLGLPLSLRLALSGTPVLNAQNNGIDLADVRIEEVRMPAVPFFNIDTKKFGSGDESLPTLPLLQFRPDELNRDGIVYQPTAIALETFGLRVALTAK